MVRIFFMAFEAAGQYNLIKKLRNQGHKLTVAEPRYPEFYNLLKQQIQPPEVIVCDCSRLPSHARESCHYIQSLPAYRAVPVVFYNVRADEEAKCREKVPTATLLSNDDVQTVIDGLAGRPSAQT